MATSISPVLVDTFKYQPLDFSAQEIRLLWIRPASSPYDLIECSLHVTKLEKSTKYIVCRLGEIDQPRDHAILCDNQLCQVSEGVYSRLFYLRGLGWQWVWVDRICVNQRDTREWAKQIDMTPAIYKQASRCFWQVPSTQYELSTLTRSDQIRLIELLPANTKTAPLRCQFNVVSLDHSPKFTLVDVNFPIPKELDQCKAYLDCNENLLPVQPILSWALRALLSQGTTTFWIHSVCVNGEDPADQKHHAALLGKILQKANERIRIQCPMFQYSKLDSAKNQIRLLRIRPSGSVNWPMVIEVITASLDEKPDYIALSYVWGSNDRHHDVLCVGGSTIPLNEESLPGIVRASAEVFWSGLGRPGMHKSARPTGAWPAGFHNEPHIPPSKECRRQLGSESSL